MTREEAIQATLEGRKIRFPQGEWYLTWEIEAWAFYNLADGRRVFALTDVKSCFPFPGGYEEHTA